MLKNKSDKPLRLLFCSLFALVLLAGCGAESEKQIPSAEIQSIDLFPDNLTFTRLDTELTLNIIAIDQNNEQVALMNGILWTSSDDAILTVDNQGKIKVLALGKVTVSASFGELKDSVEISINESALFVQGTLQYEDKPYDSGGFISSDIPTYNNIRFATVELLDDKNKVVETTRSDANGEFKFSHVIPEKFSIRVLAQVTADPAPGFVVQDMSGYVYAVTKAAVSSETTYNIKISTASQAAGAFNLLDVFVSAAEYSREKLSTNVSDLSIFWEANNDLGTYYCSGFDRDFCMRGEGVYVLNTPRAQFPDTDEFDDDVLLHEFGHFVMEKYFVDDSPAGCHFITTNDSDLSLAWSEGWGTFFGSAVKSWLKQTPGQSISSRTDVTSYIDTDGSTAFLSYDLAQIAFEGAAEENFYYASNEAAVSKILWSIFELYDMDKIRDVIANHFMQSSQPTNLANFWQGLLKSSLYDEGQLAELTTIFAERKVFYQQDSFENDDNIATASVIKKNATDVPDHYLYKDDLSQDIDMFAFDIEANVSYQIKTRELRNGIDTFIRILDERGSVVEFGGERMENDDAIPGRYYRFDNDPACRAGRFFNDKTSLASQLEFTASSSGRYFIEVSHNSTNLSKFGAVGPYGSYQLTIDQISM